MPVLRRSPVLRSPLTLLQLMHVIEQFPAILLRQSAGNRTPHHDMEIPVVGGQFLWQFLYYDIGPHVLIYLAATFYRDRFPSIAVTGNFFPFVQAIALVARAADKARLPHGKWGLVRYPGHHIGDEGNGD